MLVFISLDVNIFVCLFACLCT